MQGARRSRQEVDNVLPTLLNWRTVSQLAQQREEFGRASLSGSWLALQHADHTGDGAAVGALTTPTQGLV
eukprot:scaffold1167_cov418-Prasinococcus_capsulatus_cf.AAC.34